MIRVGDNSDHYLWVPHFQIFFGQNFKLMIAHGLNMIKISNFEQKRQEKTINVRVLVITNIDYIFSVDFYETFDTDSYRPQS